MLSSPAPRELVVVANASVGLRVKETGLFSTTSTPIDSLRELLVTHGASLQPLFGLSEDLIDSQRSSHNGALGERLPLPSLFYKVSASDDQFEVLAELLRQDASIEAAYIKPGVEPPIFDTDLPSRPERDSTPGTPTQIFDQPYLGPAPGGLNAASARPFRGGAGKGIGIVDVEGAWRFTHEDLKENQGGVAGGIQHPCLLWRNHGTAVLGIISGDNNSFGITGICPGANVRGVSVFGQPSGNFPKHSGTAAAIRQAADLLDEGGILLLELQSPGPPDFEVRLDQRGYIPVEWWPDNLFAIQYAIAKKRIVVEAAANGGSSLDAPIYTDSPAYPYGPFPSFWSNPFSRKTIDSGAIMVGAGAPPIGTNGVNDGADRSRLAFSNYGNILDVQGWGSQVTTCGFGNAQRGPDQDRWYTKFFNGTSSAAAMIAGVLGFIQGVLREHNQPLLTPVRARQLLRDTGSSQEDGPNGPASQRIGNRPDIMAMLTKLGFPWP